MKLFALLLAGAAAFAAAPAKDRMVVVMSIDGLPAYALEDARLPMPTLRRLVREGVAARGMRPVNPSVTWPNHTSMVTGVAPRSHLVLFNGTLTRQHGYPPVKIEPWIPKEQMVHAPTVYDAAHKAGLTTAQVDWVAISKAPTITWEFAERPDPQGAIPREMIADGIVTEEEVATFAKSSGAWRDRIWTRAAEHLIRRHRPNLLLYHLLNLDSINHRYGPRSAASYSAMAFADDRLRDILGTLRAAGVEQRTTILVVSDHGFKDVGKTLHPNVLLKEKGAPGYVVPEGGTAMVYTDDAARAKQVFAGAEGIDRVIEPAEFHSLGLPTPGENEQAPNLVLAARDGYAFGGGQTGKYVLEQTEGGTHGYLSSDPEMLATFVAWGRGVRKGGKIDVIDNVTVAPLIANLLGLQMAGLPEIPAGILEGR